MGNWVKVTKSKALRYKFIAMMYLLFIALSILNMPIGWLHINKVIAPPLFAVASTSNLSQGSLAKVSDAVVQIREQFLEAVPKNEESQEFLEPTGFLVTDVFFINNGNGLALKAALQQVPQVVANLPEPKQALYEELFEEDLQNGLLDEGDEWVTWKFKHVPVSFAEVLLNELLLRLQLLEGQLGAPAKGAGDGEARLLQQAVNLDQLVYGDTLKVKSDAVLLTAQVIRDADTIKLLQDEEEFYWFTPSELGAYELVLRSKHTEERYTFEVLPARLSAKNKRAFANYFEGTTNELRFGVVLSGGQLKCSSDPSATYVNGTIRFTPQTPGWSKFRLYGKNGVLVLNDSVYVHAKPTPKIKIKGLQTDGSLPAGQEVLELEAFYSGMDLRYQVTSFQYQVLGEAPKATPVLGSSLNIEGVSGTLWIHDVEAKSGATVYKSDNSYIVTIEP